MLLSLLITLIVAASILYIYLDKQLPDVDELKSVQLPIPMRIYTSDGQAIAEFGELHRNLVKLNEVPNLMVKAFLATEDQRFLEHHGVDFYGLLRAATEVLLTGSKVQGGSTLKLFYASLLKYYFHLKSNVSLLKNKFLNFISTKFFSVIVLMALRQRHRFILIKRSINLPCLKWRLLQDYLKRLLPLIP